MLRSDVFVHKSQEQFLKYPKKTWDIILWTDSLPSVVLDTTYEFTDFRFHSLSRVFHFVQQDNHEQRGNVDPDSNTKILVCHRLIKCRGLYFNKLHYLLVPDAESILVFQGINECKQETFVVDEHLKICHSHFVVVVGSIYLLQNNSIVNDQGR